jgi:soluble lytic murein transglycosylase-like protein
MSNRPHRRAEDRESTQGPDAPEEAAATPRATPRKRRNARDLLTKFRQPIIGLGLAGAAAPMLRSDNDKPQPTPDDTAGAQHSPATATGEIAATGADLEEKIATKIGETRAVSERDEAVTYAVDRYGIPQDLAHDIYDAASEAGIDHKLAFGLVKTESAFKTRAVSHVGARGLTQVMPRTAKWLRPGTRADDLFDRKTNLNLGFNYLNQLIGKYRGDVKLALTAYNRGPGTVDKVLKRGGNPDNGYAGKVIKG